MGRVAWGAVFVLGCYPYQPLVRQPVVTPSAAERWRDLWCGRAEDDVLMHFGKPVDVLTLSNGNWVDSYHREIPVSHSQSGAFIGQYTGSAAGQSDSTIIYCDRRFEIDKQSLWVVNAIITGTSCNFEQ